MSVFSEIPAEKILLRSRYFFLFHDACAVSEGHLLIISAEEKPGGKVVDLDDTKLSGADPPPSPQKDAF